MTPTRPKAAAGVTLIEIMVTILIIMIAVLGSAGYRYHSALDARKAEVRINGASLASLLLNTWNGTGGNSDYDPNDIVTGSELEIYDNAAGPAVPGGFSALDPNTNPDHRIVVDSVNYYATLSYKDEEGRPRLLDVCVAWMNNYQPWTGSAPYQSVNLNTYVSD